MAKSPTKPSTPKLSELARHVVAPEGVVSTGFPAVAAKLADLGISFRVWQKPVGRLILAKRADGKYAATIGGTGLSIPRQVGKTFLVGAIAFALCLLFPNLTVIWTSHRLRTAEETFKKMLAMSRRKRIAPYMLRPVLGSGEEEIRFRNGSRILFGARERGFGRGFDEVDVLIFDEAQILGENALDDMIPATNQTRQPSGALLLYMGTPPKPTDRGEVFTRMRVQALSGEDHDTAWVEFGADRDYKPPPLPAPLTEADWRQVAKANPSFPHDTPRESILRMRKNLEEDAFPREGLGIWDEAGGTGVIPMASWNALRADAPAGDPVAFGVDTTWGRDFSTLGWCAQGYVDVHEHRKGTGWVVEECRNLQAKYPNALVWVHPKGPAGVLIEELRAGGVRVQEITAEDYSRSCNGFFDAVIEGKIHHSGHPALDAAVGGAVTRGGESWVWDRKRGAVISPLVAVNLAWWAWDRGRGDILRAVW